MSLATRRGSGLPFRETPLDLRLWVGCSASRSEDTASGSVRHVLARSIQDDLARWSRDRSECDLPARPAYFNPIRVFGCPQNLDGTILRPVSRTSLDLACGTEALTVAQSYDTADAGGITRRPAEAGCLMGRFVLVFAGKWLDGWTSVPRAFATPGTDRSEQALTCAAGFGSQARVCGLVTIQRCSFTDHP